jgi:hypothetical protein
MPVAVGLPLILSGFFFHQVHLADSKGWSLAWLASFFIGFAIGKPATVLIVGPMIDRFGAVRLLPYYPLPMALGLLALAVSEHPYAAFPYLAGSGISTGMWFITWRAVGGVVRSCSLGSDRFDGASDINFLRCPWNGGHGMDARSGHHIRGDRPSVGRLSRCQHRRVDATGAPAKSARHQRLARPMDSEPKWRRRIPQRGSTCKSERFQRLSKIGNQIIRVFDPHRQSHKVKRHRYEPPLVVLVWLDQALDAA